jgi:hypothetical protein
MIKKTSATVITFAALALPATASAHVPTAAHAESVAVTVATAQENPIGPAFVAQDVKKKALHARRVMVGVPARDPDGTTENRCWSVLVYHDFSHSVPKRCGVLY